MSIVNKRPYNAIFSTCSHLLIAAIVCTVFVSSCKKDKDEVPDTPSVSEDTPIEELIIDENFGFQTTQSLNVYFTDVTTSHIQYSIYAAFDTEEEELISKGNAKNGVFTTSVVVPAFCERIKVVRNANGRTSSTFIPVFGTNITYDFSPTGKTHASGNCFEKLYAVNGVGGFYFINNEDGRYTETQLSNLVGGGSIACAVNRERRIVYYNTNKTLRYYDIDNATFHVAQEGNPFNGNYPRMEYNHTDSMLYIARNEVMYIVDPLTNNIESKFSIVGLQSPVGGGDVAISLDGTIYMCCFSGLYRIAINGNIANATRISAENLPFKPTSMAIDRNDRLYLATNDANSKLIEMDKFDGAWSIAKVYKHKINDLGSLPCDVEDLPQEDSDGDGIINAQDDFPNDSNKAFTLYTPSELGYGSMGFEDLWPNKGDYDFNDLVIDYRFIQVADPDNQIVEIQGKFILQAIGAGFHNGFGFEMPIAQNKIDTVYGHQSLSGLVTFNQNGTESGHNNAVIIVFEDAYNHMQPSGGAFVNTLASANYVTPDTIDVVIRLVAPTDPSDLGNPPFNPFIFVDRDRSHEVHLANGKPTALADLSLLGTGEDISDPTTSRYYKSGKHLPWALHIIHKFRHPTEEQAINTAYNKFNDWATSGGRNFPDWYKDNSGYRNIKRLYGF